MRYTMHKSTINIKLCTFTSYTIRTNIYKVNRHVSRAPKRTGTACAENVWSQSTTLPLMCESKEHNLTGISEQTSTTSIHTWAELERDQGPPAQKRSSAKAQHFHWCASLKNTTRLVYDNKHLQHQCTREQSSKEIRAPPAQKRSSAKTQHFHSCASLKNTTRLGVERLEERVCEGHRKYCDKYVLKLRLWWRSTSRNSKDGQGLNII